MADALSNIKNVYLAGRAYVNAELVYQPYGPSNPYPVSSMPIKVAIDALKAAIEVDQPGWDPDANTDASSTTAVVAYVNRMCILSDAYKQVFGVGDASKFDRVVMFAPVYGSADYPTGAYTNSFTDQLVAALSLDVPTWVRPTL